MKKETSFKSFLVNISNWLTHKKQSDIQARDDNPANSDGSSGFTHSAAAIHQSPRKAEVKHDRYYPLYLQDRDVNSHF